MSLKVNNKKASDDQFNQAADLIGLDEEVRLSSVSYTHLTLPTNLSV